MSLLVVGLSHRTTPLPVLERVSLSVEAVGKLLDDVVAAPAVDEAMVLSTCNRVELYASVEKFHAGVAALSELLARHTGVAFDELSMPEIIATAAVGNHRSSAVMERLGMRGPEAVFRFPDVPGSNPLGQHVLYRISREQWAELNAA